MEKEQIVNELYGLASDVNMQAWFLDDSINLLCEMDQDGIDDHRKSLINIVTRDLMQIKSELERLTAIDLVEKKD